MTDPNQINLAKRTLAEVAQRITDYLLGEQTLANANIALVLIREQCQDALGELMEREKQDRE